MSGLLPIIEQLADARTNRDRAEWLLKCPLNVLAKYDFTIRNRLINASFPAGIDYLERVSAAMGGVRHRSGLLSDGQNDVLEVAGIQLMAACAPVEDPSHSITDL